MKQPRTVTVGKVKIGNHLPFALIAGPCVLESRDHAFDMAGKLKELTKQLDIPFIYKTSFDKANRTSINSVRGLGLEESLEIFKDLRKKLDIPLLTDVHESNQCDQVAAAVDVLQIPAFLCRQTDLLLAAGKTGKAINIKKGQFLAPWDIKHSVNKIRTTGNDNILVCERGTSFGYNTLVSDFRGLPIMASQTECPIVFDATHSVQQPGGQGTSSGGQREFVPILARAAVSIGVAAVFMETHETPDTAPSDGPNMVPFKQMKNVLETLKEFDEIAKRNPVDI